MLHVRQRGLAAGGANARLPDPAPAARAAATATAAAARGGSTGGGSGSGGLSGYRSLTSQVLALVNQLHEHGVAGDLQVPTLVVAGNQSSGKSSVVEAIAGVALPRASGTCTRCPTEVRMRTSVPGEYNVAGSSGSAAAATSSSSLWSCRIKLQIVHDNAGQELPERPREQLFCELTDKAHIAPCVTAAQAVLLNPREAGARGAAAFVPQLRATSDVWGGSMLGGGGTGSGLQLEHSAAFRDLGDASSYELRFTYNTVVLEIEGAEVDLTIKDLPGIIQSHPDGPRYVELVRRMTQDNLAPPHHIIVMTLTAMDDLENQAIKLWAREVDPEGARTLAVITKPDNIPAGEHAKWISLLTNQTPLANPHHLALGYHAVKNPGQDRLDSGISFEQAREEERDFFRAEPRWATAVATHPSLASRLGTNSLRCKLSRLLIDQITRQLPEMRERAKKELQRVQRELAGLPKPPSDAPLYELQDLIREVCTRIAAQVRADEAADATLYQAFSRAYEDFGAALRGSMPAFYLGGRLIAPLSAEEKGLLAGSSSSSSAGGGGTGSGGSSSIEADELDVSELLKASKFAPGDEAGARWVPSAEEVRQALQDEGDEGGRRLRNAMAEAGFPLSFESLDEVAELRRRHIGRELPTFSPYRATEKLLSRFKGVWASLATECLGVVVDALRAPVEQAVEAETGRYPAAARELRAQLAYMVEEMAADTASRLEGLVGCEDGDVFTLNIETFRQHLLAFQGRLKRSALQLGSLQAETYVTRQISTMLLEISAHLRVNAPSMDDLLLALPYKYDEELHMMAACLAYYKVVFRRLQDEVPLHVRGHLLAALGRGEQLAAQLRVRLLGAQGDWQEGEEVARSLLCEDPEVALQRTQLEDKQRRLAEAVRLLHAPAAAGL